MNATHAARRRWVIVAMIGAVAVAASALSAASHVTLSALEGPGPFETWAAARAKQWIIGRAAAAYEPRIPTDETAIALGAMRFRGECAPCHGVDGRSLTEIGRGLYPRAVDLGSSAVQTWSDPQLFWIIKHGVRFTGMPAFGSALGDDEIAALVAYMRSLVRTNAPGVSSLTTNNAYQRSKTS